jgi:Rad3-related DNA helicase
MIQKSYKDGYQSEVFLRHQTQIGDTDVILEGRADGVLVGADGRITVDEIKTTALMPEAIKKLSAQHFAQVKCYAYMLLSSHEALEKIGSFQPEPINEIEVQVTYYQLETGEITKQCQSFTFLELNAFFCELMEKYGVWMRYEQEWKETRDRSIHDALFPFPSYRKGQRALAVAVYKTIGNGGKLYAQAPTGIGKTLSALFPSIKAIAEDQVKKLFYLTAKTVTRAVAEEAIRLMVEKGLRFKSLTLRAKDKICPMEEAVCNPDYCDRAKGHYDRINEALLDLLGSADVITPAEITAFAQKHRVCPHEMGLDAAVWADLVIGDYNHVFDPTVYLKRFFSEVTEPYVFLIDEAHNLADRVRDMYSAEVTKSRFYQLKKQLKDKNHASAALRSALGSVNQYLLLLRKELEGESRRSRAIRLQDTDLDERMLAFITAAGEWLTQERYHAHPLQPELLELYFDALSFVRAAESYNACYCCIQEVSGSEVSVTYFCLDPSEAIKACLVRARATVMFSATLTPLPYYREILGGSRDDDILSLLSPFDRERLLLTAHTGISTKYQDREASVEPISDAIYVSVSKRKGNYLVFFPSYTYMRSVYAALHEQHPGLRIAVQQSSMDEGERAAFLEQFDAENAETLVGFCVLGGIFSEGIDLKGERLIGCVIVGVGLPMVSLRQNLIRDYYDSLNGSGFDYAYVFPGMNKVLQAAGRIIRSESDWGLAVLIDSRFGFEKYRALFPEHWSHIKTVSSVAELAQLVDGFKNFPE